MAPDAIGITGSAGKTSARNAVYAILKNKYRVKISSKANSESGIPLNILGLKPTDYSVVDWLRLIIMAPIKFLTNWQVFDKYIVEMGIDAPTPPKNMEYLLTIIKPRTAVFLNVLQTHTQFFSGIDEIAKEKGKLIESLPKNGLAVLNADDPKVIQFKTKTKATVMTFGIDKANDVSVETWQVSRVGTKFKFNDVWLTLPYLLPEHFGQTLAAALCIALDEDYTLKEGCDLLRKNFRLPKGRASLIEGKNGSIIIDSSYNASPTPMMDMLTLLTKIPGKRKLALLGDMRELGPETEGMHERVIRQALNTADEVHLVGPKMRLNILSGAVWHENALKAAEGIKLKAGDVLLVKGSQNTLFLEAAVEKLMAYPEKASILLCRRGNFWDKQRHQALV